MTTAADGKSYKTTVYNLDAIVAIGMKVNSDKARAFRKWARTVLKGYIENGYALNGKRLDQDPAALMNLAREVRAIRTSEKNLYTQVREAFAECAIMKEKERATAKSVLIAFVQWLFARPGIDRFDLLTLVILTAALVSAEGDRGAYWFFIMWFVPLLVFGSIVKIWAKRNRKP